MPVTITDPEIRKKLAKNLEKARAALAEKRKNQKPDPATLTRPTPPASRDRVAARRYLEHEAKRAQERLAAIRALLDSLNGKT